MQWYIKVLTQYADFDGRARRTEYWMFGLINTLVTLVLMLLMFGVVAAGSGGRGGAAFGVGTAIVGLLYVAYFLGVLVPTLAVTVRRLHDTDRSGWWILIGLIPYVGGLVLLIFGCIEGTRGPNRYGPDPKAPAFPGPWQYPGYPGQAGPAMPA